jgi:hypothetical protein
MIATVFTALTLAASCHAHGPVPFVAPDNTCTPGQYLRLSRAQVCASKDRPSLRAAVRRRVLANYGVPGWKGANGEIDHRVPFFLGGTTTVGNLWPEAGPDPRVGQNPKDRLEEYVRRRVCTSTQTRPRGTMSVGSARRIFLSDWRFAYRWYFG